MGTPLARASSLTKSKTSTGIALPARSLPGKSSTWTRRQILVSIATFTAQERGSCLGAKRGRAKEGALAAVEPSRSGRILRQSAAPSGGTGNTESLVSRPGKYRFSTWETHHAPTVYTLHSHINTGTVGGDLRKDWGLANSLRRALSERAYAVKTRSGQSSTGATLAM